jgi:hypothetical protein
MESMEAAVYRVAPGSPGFWNVYQDSLEKPIATFHEKALALSYAMGLARGKVSWDLLPGGTVENLRNPRAGHGHGSARHA